METTTSLHVTQYIAEAYTSFSKENISKALCHKLSISCVLNYEFEDEIRLYDLKILCGHLDVFVISFMTVVPCNMIILNILINLLLLGPSYV